MAVVASGELDLRLSSQSAGKLESQIGGVTAKAGASASSKFSAALGGAFAAAGAVKVFGSFITEATEAAKVGRDTAAVVKSMGPAAGVTATDIEKLATKLSILGGVDDELVQQNLNVLRTFGNIQNTDLNKTFDQAALAAANLSARFGGDLSSATIQVGKALNDPIKGMAALSRVGVQFSLKQKATIQALVETGDVLGAQKIILKELNSQTAGAFAAAATPAAKLKVSLDNVKESLGTALLPIVEKVANAFVNMSPGLQKVVVVGGLLVGLLAALAPALAIIVPILAGITAAGLITAGMFVAVGLIVAGLAIIIVKNWDTIKNATLAAFNFVKDVIVGVFNFVKGVVVTEINIIKGVITGFGKAISAVWDGFKAAASAAFAFIKRIWNSTVGGFGIPSISIGPFKTPGFKIPKMHEGGVFQAPFGQREGLALLRSGERVLTPGQSAGNVFHVNVTFAGALPTDAQAYTAGQAVGRGAAAEMERADARRAARVA